MEKQHLGRLITGRSPVQVRLPQPASRGHHHGRTRRSFLPHHPGLASGVDRGRATRCLGGRDQRALRAPVTSLEINRVSNRGGFRPGVTETGVVISGIYCLDLNHATLAIQAEHGSRQPCRLLLRHGHLCVGHSCPHADADRLGTFDGTNNVATFDASGEGLLIFFDGTGKGRVIFNNGEVALSELSDGRRGSDNGRQEAFARAIAEGKSQIDAYAQAGYKVDPAGASSGQRSPSKLQAMRGGCPIKELQAKASSRSVYTLDKLVEMLVSDRKFARKCENPSASVSATVGIAKLLGIGGIAEQAKDPEAGTEEGAAAQPNPNVIAMKDAIRKLRGG